MSRAGCQSAACSHTVHLGTVCLCLMSLAGLGCENSEAPAEQAPHLQLLYDGCEPTAQKDRCLFKPGDEFSLWIEDLRGLGSRTRFEVTLNGESLNPKKRESRADGFLLRFEIPDGVHRLKVRSSLRRGFDLALHPRPPEDPALGEARRLWDDGRAREGRDLLQKTLDTTPIERRGPVLSLLGRLQRSVDSAGTASQVLEDAVAHHREFGTLSAVVNDTTLLVYIARESGGDLSESKTRLSALSDLALNHAMSAYLKGYYGAMLASYFGETQEALAAFEETSEIAVRMGWEGRVAMVQQLLSPLLQKMGHHAEAIDHASQIVRSVLSGSNACAKVEALTNYAWSILLLRETGGALDTSDLALDGSATRVLSRALESQPKCSDVREALATIHANRVLDALQRHSTSEARDALTALKSIDTMSVDVARWMLDLRGRLALLEREPKRALALYQDFRSSATNLEDAWRAQVGVARAELALGAVESAHRAYEYALSIERNEGRAIPFDQGRGLFLAQREGVAQEYIRSLLKSDEVEAALSVVRQRRVSTLRDLAARQRIESLSESERRGWEEMVDAYRRQQARLEEARANVELAPIDGEDVYRHRLDRQRRRTQKALDRLLRAADDFAPEIDDAAANTPPDDVAELHVYGLGALWGLWLSDTHGTEFYAIERFDDPIPLATAAISTFKERLSSVKQLRLFVPEELSQVDFYSSARAVLGGTNGLEIVFSLDLPMGDRRLTPARRALVVSDPRGDLPQARSEGERTSRRLHELGYSVRVLSGSHATVVAVREGLKSADVFHYSGHGSFSEDDEWSSHLPLFDGRFSVSDILMQDSPPSLVVLAGCETARTTSESPQFGLAQAFLAAGGDYVIASARPIADALGRSVAQHFWNRFDGQKSVPAVWEEAVGDLRLSNPSDDWNAFRLLTR
ncbi:MAG: CHAT domain-containing protein [Myxococcota bacterium]